jgi:hypothetical protein
MTNMRRIALFLSLALFLAAAPAKKPAPEAKPAPDAKALEFPNNEAGRHAAAWFEAFNKGDEAMRKYIQAHVAPSALARRTVQDRMDIYHDMKDERGRVTPVSIESFTESNVKAIARGERGGRFAITFRCEEEAPHGLLGLQVEDLPPEEGTPEGIEEGGYSQAPAGPRMKEAQVAAALRAYVDSLARADAFPARSCLRREIACSSGERTAWPRAGTARSTGPTPSSTSAPSTRRSRRSRSSSSRRRGS